VGPGRFHAVAARGGGVRPTQSLAFAYYGSSVLLIAAALVTLLLKPPKQAETPHGR
jgi:hypothetical protein